VWCVTNNFNYFRVFRRHAALFVVAIAPLWLLLTPCLTTKSIGNIVQVIHDTPHHSGKAHHADGAHAHDEHAADPAGG
jgi:hypothetical protein